jgi:hypothetical protein
MRKKLGLPALLLLFAVATVQAEPSGRHFVYAQYDFILTFELTSQKEAILNVVNFTSPTYYIRTQHIILIDSQDKLIKVEKIVMETGNPADPFKTSNMKILPNSFIGLVLQGDFSSVEKLKSVSVQLGNSIYKLDSLSDLQFNIAADKINKMNFDSPDVREDFRVLKMDFFGSKEPAKETRP